ncbi:MAG: hypothetical protein RIS64_1692 [Bacteroidota bacterium]
MEDEDKIKQLFAEIFKFYNNQPHFQAILQLYLVYIMAQQGEIEGLTPVEIMLKVNDLSAEPVVTELEVANLLTFFKEQPVKKTSTRRIKKD